MRGANKYLLVLLIALGGSVARPAMTAQSPEDAAERVVRACYRWHFSHDKAFTDRSVHQKERWLAPDLLTACSAYLARTAGHEGAPSIEGDPFTDSQEYPRSHRVGTANIDGGVASVPVTMIWRHERRIVTVKLRQIDGAWRISDLVPEGTPPLTSLLMDGT